MYILYACICAWKSLKFSKLVEICIFWIILFRIFSLSSYSVKDKSSNSDVYSESFESTVSKKSLSALSISPPFKNSSPSNSIKKDCGPGIRLPLVPRNLRRHDSSGSDDSYTISQSGIVLMFSFFKCFSRN